jgi:hypothetical protein
LPPWLPLAQLPVNTCQPKCQYFHTEDYQMAGKEKINGDLSLLSLAQTL